MGRGKGGCLPDKHRSKSGGGRTSRPVSSTQVAVLCVINPSYAISFPSIEGKSRVLKGQCTWMTRYVKVITFALELSPFIKFDVENLHSTEAKEKEKGEEETSFRYFKTFCGSKGRYIFLSLFPPPSLSYT